MLLAGQAWVIHERAFNFSLSDCEPTKKKVREGFKTQGRDDSPGGFFQAAKLCLTLKINVACSASLS